MDDGEIKITKDWKILPRMSRQIPFGYYVDPNDKDLLIPNVLELEALERAKKHVKRGYSYRDTAIWLLEVTGRSISHAGLRKRIDHDRRKRNKFAGLKLSAARYEKALAKLAKANESQRTRTSEESPLEDSNITD